jgi:DNA invertase Pin-like site-specific DNA recombinase
MGKVSTVPQAVILLRARHIGGEDEQSRATAHAMITWQRRRCREAADRLDTRLVREYVEYGGAGPIDKRPQLRLMLDELRALRDARYVIVASHDRLARRKLDWQTILFELDAAGTELIVAHEGN